MENEDDRCSFAGYVINDKGNISKQSKVNWPKSVWVNLFEMCKRQRISLFKKGDLFVYEMTIDEEISMTFNSPNNFYTVLKQQLLQRHETQFKAKQSQGRVTREAGNVNHRLSAAYLNNHKITDNLRAFVARSRLQTLQCDSLMSLYYPTAYNKSCKICHHPSETASHVLNGCTKFQRLYQQRHNRIVDILYNKIKDSNLCNETLKDTVLKPQMFNGQTDVFTHTHTKPDITVIDRQNKHVLLVEVSTPFDAHIPKCFQGKFDKYFLLSLEINHMSYRSD